MKLCSWCLPLLGACSLVFDPAATGTSDATPKTPIDSGSDAAIDALPCYNVSPGCPTNTVGAFIGQWQKLDGSCSCYIAGLKRSARLGHDRCADLGAHLIAIESRSEQEAVLAMLDPKPGELRAPFLIGLIHNDEEWLWTTGETILETGYTSVLTNETLPITQHCAKFNIQIDGQWEPTSCDEEDDIVCELDGKEDVVRPPSELPIDPPT